MPALDKPALYLVGTIAFGLLVFLVRSRFSTERREQRRRDRSHRPVVSRKPGPTVKLAARVDKPKRKD